MTKQQLVLTAVEAHVQRFGLSPTLAELASFLVAQGVYDLEYQARVALSRMRRQGLLWPTTHRGGVPCVAFPVGLTEFGRRALAA